MQWVLKFSEYEFEIIHKPGKKHINADVLSRHIASVQPTPEVTVDLMRETIFSEQQTGVCCQEQRNKLTTDSESKLFLNSNGNLCYKETGHSTNCATKFNFNSH